MLLLSSTRSTLYAHGTSVSCVDAATSQACLVCNICQHEWLHHPGALQCASLAAGLLGEEEALLNGYLRQRRHICCPECGSTIQKILDGEDGDSEEEEGCNHLLCVFTSSSFHSFPSKLLLFAPKHALESRCPFAGPHLVA